MKSKLSQPAVQGEATLADAFRSFPKSCRGLLRFDRRWGSGYVETAPEGTLHIQDYILKSAEALLTLNKQLSQIQEISGLVLKALKSGRKILTAGNGGSAAEAMHLAEELTGKYSKPRRALAGVCLCADATALTCIANDWDFSQVFSRQVEALARKGDVLVLFTTSGNSENCLKAARAMRKAGGKVVGLLGKDGGKAKGLCDVALVVESERTNHIQEAHQVVLHLILEAVEAEFS